MMTQTQKRIFEWPMLLVAIWALQALEISLLQLPAHAGGLNVISILSVYLALTRSWPVLLVLSTVLAVMASAAVTHSGGVVLAAYVWTALATKAAAQAFALEGRRQFTGLVAGAFVFRKALTFVLLSTFDVQPTLTGAIGYTLAGVVPAAIAGWFLFPLFMAWDAYFLHEAEDARELNPDRIK